jgi:hypothetical protein
MVFCFVVPAQAGIQGFQSLALGPRFRGGDDVRGLRDWITASFAGVTINERYCGYHFASGA